MEKPLPPIDPRRNGAQPDFVSIRGIQLDLSKLVDPRLFDAAHRAELRQQLQDATPFEHLVLDGWFSPDLLKLAWEEFDLYPFRDERETKSKYENTVRSPRNPVLGPASRLYFDVVNSGWFTELLSAVTGVTELLVDQTLRNGGLHESRRGGKFSIHRDFERNACTGLKTEMVLLTYLNETWDPSWNGALELWDADRGQCVRKIEPQLGRSVLMRNGPVNFHGHPTPLAIPEGQVRRSLASYYYSNAVGWNRHRGHASSVYLYVDRSDRVKQWAKQATPPLIWDALRRIRR
jgi:hypothetical protein